MDTRAIVKLLEETGKDKFVKFVADKGKNSCDKCLQYHGKIFNSDDPNKPQLPIHPSCRCKYEAVKDSTLDSNAKIEQNHIARVLKEKHKLQEEEAKELASQVTKARNENSKLREQRLFLIFNGRYLMSSDGKFLQNAVSGEIAKSKEIIHLATVAGTLITTTQNTWDYSYERQASENIGGLPQGLYSITCKESGSLSNGNIKKHGRDVMAWGNYHWQLVPDDKTDTRGRRRNSFTIHGGLFPGSAGCIDLTSGDAKFKKYLKSLNLKTIYVYAQYVQTIVTLEKDRKGIYPIIP
jgi:hypothetical protein